MIACAVSLLSTGRLTPTLVIGSTIAWAFVPVAELAGFLVALRSAKVSRSRVDLIDSFFAGHGPWTWYAVAVGAAGAVLTPWQMNAWGVAFMAAIEAAAVATAVRSWFIDVAFYETMLARTRRDAIRAALVQRAVCWPITVIYFAGYAAWPLIRYPWPR